MSSKPAAVLLFAVLACVAFAVQQAFGQAAPGAVKVIKSLDILYDDMKPVDPADFESEEAAAAEEAIRARARTAAFNDARKVMAGQIPLDDNGKKILDKWYKGYFLPNFTQPQSRGELPELRDALLNRDLRTARSSAAVAYVRGVVITYMSAFAQSPAPKYNFHPAVRYNAMLVIGSLNEVEYGARYANDQKALVPDPLPQAFDLLVSEFKSPTQIDAVKVAALVGLDRHIKLDLARPVERRIPGLKKLVVFNEMIALLNAPPPPTRSAEGHAWMQRRAIEILGALGTVGIKAETNTALEKIVADKDAPISLRCTASEALALWAPNAKAKIDASAVSRHLGLMAIKVCNDELDRIAALERQEKEMAQLRELLKKPNAFASGQLASTPGAGGGPGMSMDMYGGGESYGASGAAEDDSMGGADMSEMYGGMEMYGGGMPGAPGTAVPTDPRILWSQRRLKYQLACVKHGLDGMALVGKASQHEKVVDQVAKAVEEALKLTDPPEEKPDLEGLAESIRKGLEHLAFLAPEAADPLTEVPAIDPAAPPGEPAIPGVDPAALPGEPAVPGVDPAALPGVDPALPGGLPPGVE